MAEPAKCTKCEGPIGATDRVVLVKGDLFHERCPSTLERVAETRKATEHTRRPGPLFALIIATGQMAERACESVASVGGTWLVVSSARHVVDVTRLWMPDLVLLDAAFAESISDFVGKLPVPAGKIVLVGDLTPEARESAAEILLVLRADDLAAFLLEFRRREE